MDSPLTIGWQRSPAITVILDAGNKICSLKGDAYLIFYHFILYKNLNFTGTSMAIKLQGRAGEMPRWPKACAACCSNR